MPLIQPYWNLMSKTPAYIIIVLPIVRPNSEDELAMISEEEEVEEQPDPADQDTLVFESEESEEELFNTTIDTTSDDSAITMGKSVTSALISDHIQIPTEQVGCL